ncbi:MAG: hypothetical protein JW914_07375 [Syntrophaceae bacterium]|nr:hypothetical protein [Syntrophaceae bacterium]
MIRRKIADYLSRKKFIIKLIENPVDLSILRRRPTFRLVTGLILIGVSYIIGWPAVAAFGVLAVWYKEPLIAIIGGPVTYGLSHVVFILGAWLTGMHQHLGTLIKYVLQAFIRKYSTKIEPQ